MRFAHFVLSCAAILTIGPRAYAQTGADEAVRAELIDAAREAHRADDHARALDLATRAGAIRWTGTLRGFVAREQLALGRLADALGNVELCVRQVPSEPPSAGRDAILAWCNAQTSALREGVGRVVVQVPSPPAELRVTVSGSALRTELFGVPYVVTPGTVVVEATAPGHQPLRREVEVARGVEVPVVMTLQRTPAASAPPPAASVVSVTDVRAPTRRVRSPVGLAVMGVGAASAVAGLVMWVVASGRHSDLDARCSGRCAQDEINREREPIDDLGTAAGVTAYGGLGLVAVGGALFFLLTHEAPTSRRATVVVGPGSLGVAGTF